MSLFSGFVRSCVATAILLSVGFLCEPLIKEYVPGSTPATMYVVILGAVALVILVGADEFYKPLGIGTAVTSLVGAVALIGVGWWTATTIGGEGVVRLAVAWILISIYALSISFFISAYTYGGGLEEDLAKVEQKKAN